MSKRNLVEAFVFWNLIEFLKTTLKNEQNKIRLFFLDTRMCKFSSYKKISLDILYKLLTLLLMEFESKFEACRCT